ncbi:MAG: hypothetical protein ACFB00_04050 [Parvularculaceae bacterium]
MGFFPILMLLAAGAGAVWLLARAGGLKGAGGQGRNVAIMKGVVWLGLAAVLLAAKLFPLAFMLLIAAGGVTAIEAWRERTIKDDEKRASPPATTGTRMSRGEAAELLGVPETADAGAVKAAHKRLISQLHPDKGGTDYLAAKITDARDVLLR